MRIFCTSIGAITTALFIAYAGSALAAGDALTGKMAPLNYLVGAPWTCSTKMSAMGGQPAMTGQSTVTFDIVYGNVVHDHVAAANFANDDYYGFSSNSNLYWNSSADSLGSHAFATSKDGVTFTGVSYSPASNTKVVSTYTKVNENKVTVHEVLSGDGHEGTFDAVCTR